MSTATKKKPLSQMTPAEIMALPDYSTVKSPAEEAAYDQNSQAIRDKYPGVVAWGINALRGLGSGISSVGQGISRGISGMSEEFTTSPSEMSPFTIGALQNAIKSAPVLGQGLGTGQPGPATVATPSTPADKTSSSAGSGGIARPSTPTPSTPAAPEVPSNPALDQLKQEAENTRLYGNALGQKGYESDLDKLLDSARGQTAAPTVDALGEDKLRQLMNEGRSGIGLTEQELIQTELARRNAVQQVMENFMGKQQEAAENERRKQLGSLRVLGADLGNVGGNTSSTEYAGMKTAQEQHDLERAKEAQSLYDQLNALSAESQASLDTQLQNLWSNKLAGGTQGISAYEALTGRDKDLLAQQAALEEAKAKQMTAENTALKDNRDYVNSLMERFGSQAFEMMNPEDRQNLLAQAGYSYDFGQVPLSIQELGSRDYVSGTARQKSGVFDERTGTFTPDAQGWVPPEVNEANLPIAPGTVEAALRGLQSSNYSAEAWAAIPANVKKALGQNTEFYETIIPGFGDQYKEATIRETYEKSKTLTELYYGNAEVKKSMDEMGGIKAVRNDLYEQLLVSGMDKGDAKKYSKEWTKK